MRKIDKHYISDIDKKLAEFDETHPKSRAQQVECDKYQRIYRMRDAHETIITADTQGNCDI